jgi:hypothetical protein
MEMDVASKSVISCWQVVAKAKLKILLFTYKLPCGNPFQIKKIIGHLWIAKW